MSIINNSKTDPNKILPMTYLWARQHYKDGVANNWVPEEIPMQDDIEQWKHQSALTEEERRLIYWNLGFFSTAESLTANNIVLAVYNHVTNPECRQYMLRQAYEEAIHTDTFIYCCDSLGLDPEEIYTMYQKIPSIKEKDDFVVELTKSVFDPNFNTIGDGNIQAFVHDLVGYYVIMEGVFFYAGFAMMLALKRQRKMIGIGEQFEYIMRDESIHLNFGCDLINTIVSSSRKSGPRRSRKRSRCSSKKRWSWRRSTPATPARGAFLASTASSSATTWSTSPTAAWNASASPKCTTPRTPSRG